MYYAPGVASRALHILFQGVTTLVHVKVSLLSHLKKKKQLTFREVESHVQGCMSVNGRAGSQRPAYLTLSKLLVFCVQDTENIFLFLQEGTEVLLGESSI